MACRYANRPNTDPVRRSVRVYRPCTGSGGHKHSLGKEVLGGAYSPQQCRMLGVLVHRLDAVAHPSAYSDV